VQFFCIRNEAIRQTYKALQSLNEQRQVLRGRRRARPMNEQEFKRSLERIWARE
jgi:hypothetical protein